MNLKGLSDLRGLQIGLLRVVRRLADDANGNSRWLCRCVCKAQRMLNRVNLIRQQCGKSHQRCSPSSVHQTEWPEYQPPAGGRLTRKQRQALEYAQEKPTSA